MEVKRFLEPDPYFLKKVRKFTKENNIILIFDECTTGFREEFGGLYKKFNIIPDMVIFGKALGNGYPITAILGRKELMASSSKTFLSSTFWSDRIGPTAAIATIDLMKDLKSWKIVNEKGKYIKRQWSKLFKQKKLNVNIWGRNAIIGFNFISKNNLKYKTFITQELLKKNILASNIVYVAITHKYKLIDKYFYEFDKVLDKIALFENGENIDNYINTKIANKSFKRLN